LSTPCTADLGLQTCTHLERAIDAPTGADWPALARADDHIDQLHHHILDAVGQADPPYPIQVGVDVALLARYFERFGDQAVSIAKELDYIVAGTRPNQAPG
jgi:phosphate transport system protein